MHKEIKQKFTLIQTIRNFFLKEGFLDVLTPPIVSHPGIEPHIHPFKVIPTQTSPQKVPKDLFLHSSPEFCMKELLSQGFQKIFTISSLSIFIVRTSKAANGSSNKSTFGLPSNAKPITNFFF